MTEVWSGIGLIAEQIVLPVGTFLVLLIAAVYAIGKRANLIHASEIPVLISFCLLGAVIGLFTGNSRSPVVAGLLPALVTFASAMVAYIASKETMKAWRKQVPLHLLAFLIAIALTAFYGSHLRGIADKADMQAKRQLLHYEKVELEVEKAHLLQVMRAGSVASPNPATAPAATLPHK